MTRKGDTMTRTVLMPIVLALALVVVGIGGWTLGRATGETSASENVGFDIGLVGSPPLTGELREYQLVAQEVDWEIAPGVIAKAIAYNGQVPGPTIRVTEGDTLRVTLVNELEQGTSIHWHGLHVPNDMDGVVPYSQPEIAPGESFTYEFPASHAGTFMYHSHQNAVEQIDRGLYAPLIIDPAQPTPARFDREFTVMLSAWDTTAMPGLAHQMPDSSAMPGSDSSMGGMAMNYNYFTINGKAFPANENWTIAEGDLVRVRLINISNLVHPMHLHGHDFTVIAKDGEPIRPELQQTMNTIAVNAGETFDIVFRADNPGIWIFHCHELHHTENDGVEPGGLIQAIQYAGFTPRSNGDPDAQPTATPHVGH